MKTSKKIAIGVGVFLLLLLITWGICETAGADHYNYTGHVIDIAQENGDTVITTIWGKTQSRFTLKWYTREKYKKDTKDIQIGDYIMLSTTQYSRRESNSYALRRVIFALFGVIHLARSAPCFAKSHQKSSKISTPEGALQFCASKRLGVARKKHEAIYNIANGFDAANTIVCRPKPY